MLVYVGPADDGPTSIATTYRICSAQDRIQKRHGGRGRPSGDRRGERARRLGGGRLF